jgi:hypothetical protein
MKNNAAAGVVLFTLAACAASPDKESILSKNDAIDDFIEVSDLNEISLIRIRRELQHKPITEDYIILYDGQDPYLVAFKRRCRELNASEVTPDYRYEARKLHARSDTYRGCRIHSLYEITEGQALELLSLGTM